MCEKIDKAVKEVKDEKIKDTLLDLANYATLAVLELEWEENQRVQGRDTNN